MSENGNWNTGDMNTGHGNAGNMNAGCFCTETHTMRMFDADSGLTYTEWLSHPARKILSKIRILVWVNEPDMTNDEKEKYPAYKTIGGYLKKLTQKEAAEAWEKTLTDYQRNIIRSIPNYDPDKFEAIVGVRI